MPGDPLGPSAVLKHMADALPTHEQGDTTSDLSGSLAAIALFTHACLSSLGFRVVGFHEDEKIEAECVRLAPRLPPQWNSSTTSHSFIYAHQQSAMQFIIKIDRMGGKTEIRGMGIGDDRVHRVELMPKDYISNAALPVRITMTDSGEDRGDLEQKLRAVFISEARITDLANLLKINIIQRLVPSLQKEGYQEDPDDRAARQDAEEAGRSGARQPPRMPDVAPEPARPHPYPIHDPLLPGRPLPPDLAPPGFEDEYEINRPPRGVFPPGLGMGGVGGVPGRTPFGNIGDSDLNPPGLGPFDPLRPSFAGHGGLMRPGGMGGGMHPTFDDPLFQGPGGIGGGGFDSQIPPGARYDPTGPGGSPRFGGGRPGGRGSGPFGGFGGDII